MNTMIEIPAWLVLLWAVSMAVYTVGDTIRMKMHRKLVETEIGLRAWRKLEVEDASPSQPLDPPESPDETKEPE